MRVGRVPSRDALDRRLQMIETALLNLRDQLPAETGRARRLMDDDAAAGLLHRLLDRVEVERDERAEVDHLGVDALLLDRGERDMDHRAIGQNGEVIALPDNGRLADRNSIVA